MFSSHPRTTFRSPAPRPWVSRQLLPRVPHLSCLVLLLAVVGCSQSGESISSLEGAAPRSEPAPVSGSLPDAEGLLATVSGLGSKVATHDANTQAQGGRTDGSVADTLVAREITSSADLIGGVRAAGRLGDYYLANDRIRVIIQDIDHGAQFYIFGGNIIDADIIREEGAPGKDLLGEFFVDLNLTHALEPTDITVLQDGSDGEEARIRVTGVGFPWPLFPPKEPISALPIEITQDYTLHPGEANVTIDTTVVNVGSSSISLLEAEVLLLGSSLQLNAEGLPPGEIVGPTRYLAAQGTETIGATYAFAPDSGRMTIVFEDAAQTGAILGSSRLRPGQSVTWRRHFFIGDRDVASTTDAFYAQGRDPVGRLEGTVFTSDVIPIVDAHITVLDTDGNYLTECLSDDEGRFEANLPPGEISLRITSEGRSDEAVGPYTIVAGNTSMTTAVLGPQGRLIFQAVDETGEPCPVRATLIHADGTRTYASSPRGGDEVALIPGTYQVTLSRGPEYSIAQYSVEVPPDGALVTVPATGAAVLSRVIDTTGWISGDFHLHQKNSDDSWTLFENRITMLLAEGVEVGVPTDHDHITDFGPTLEAMGLTGQLVTGVGDEVSIVDYGHFNYFPIQIDPADPDAVDGTKFYFGDDNMVLTASELFARMRENPGQEVIQINHPRSDAMGYFSMIGYNANTGVAIREPLATDFDALEIKGDVFGEDSILMDYFSLINQGLTVAAMGNSDAHRGRADNGYPRTYIRVADDRTETTTIQEVVASIHGGHTTVAAGIYATLTAEANAMTAEPGDVLEAEGGAITLTARLQCPTWMAMDQLILYGNGVPVALLPDGRGGYVADGTGDTQLTLNPSVVGGRYEQSLRISVVPEVDTHYAIVAWGNGSLGIVSGDQALGYTSPIYVDTDGGGFTAPGFGSAVGPAPEPPPGYWRKPDACGGAEDGGSLH